MYFEAGGRGGAHCQGGEERELQNGSQLTQPKSAAGLHVGGWRRFSLKKEKGRVMDNAFKGAELVEAPRDGAPSAGDDRAVREARHRDHYDAYGKRQREGQIRIGSHSDVEADRLGGLGRASS
jgi:hypothetical protein